MDRSRIIAIASGVIAVGLTVTPAAAATSNEESAPTTPYNFSAPASNAADEILGTNDYPCCV